MLTSSLRWKKEKKNIVRICVWWLKHFIKSFHAYWASGHPSGKKKKDSERILKHDVLSWKNWAMSFALAAEQILWDGDYAVHSFWLPHKNTNGQRKIFLQLHYANVLEDKVHVYLMRNKAGLSVFCVRDRAWSALKKKKRPPATLKVIRHVCRQTVFRVEIKSVYNSKIIRLWFKNWDLS